MNQYYLDDYSNEELIKKIDYQYKNDNLDTINTNSDSDDNNDIKIDNKKQKKPSITMKSDFNSKGEKIVIFSINIPLKRKDALKIDILINDDMYKNIGKHFKEQ
jgi:hypothetical protein